MNYKEYLQTEHWQTMRRLALGFAQHKCQICNNDNNLNVHHRTYERQGNERLSDLTVLCEDCHKLFHGQIEQPVEIEARQTSLKISSRWKADMPKSKVKELEKQGLFHENTTLL